MITFYHYHHCPFCIRVRLTLGYLSIPYKSVVLPYDDENTPMKLIGKKMLPIINIDGKIINESLDIIAILDEKNRLNVKQDLNPLQPTLDELGNLIHSLVMPYWAYSSEFNDSSRNYFIKKKELKRGPFEVLVKKRTEFEVPLNQLLGKLEFKLQPFFESNVISIKDILIASQLWGLYSLPEFQFSQKWHEYLQLVKKTTHFDNTFWKSDE